jgi:hypothetical protein
MSGLRFEPRTLVLEWVTTVHALDRVDTVISVLFMNSQERPLMPLP